MPTDLETPIADLSFEADFIRLAKSRAQMGTRIKNTLQRNGIMTLGQLVQAEKLPEGLGVVSHEVIRTALRTMGHKLTAKLGP